MSLSDLASLGSFVSGVAVLASLIFLFFQMRQMTEQVRQSEKNQQALISQAARSRNVDILLSRMEPSAADAILKGLSGADDISATQYQQFMGFMGANFGHYHDVFIQHKEGLITDGTFATMFWGFQSLLSFPGVRQSWKIMLATLSVPDGYKEFVEVQMDQTPVRFGSTFELWKTGISAMKANALKQ